MKIKDRHAKESSFSRALLAGIICGIASAALVVIYASVYRNMTGFRGMGFIEPSIIFVGCPLVMVLAAFIFLGMVEVWKNGEVIFVLAALVLTAGAIVSEFFFLPGRATTSAFGLLLGAELIAGLIMAFLLPFLGTHPKIFMDREELLESAQ